MIEKIRKDFLFARKDNNKEKKSALEAVIASYTKKTKEKNFKESKNTVIEVITKEVKIQQEIIDSYNGIESERALEAKAKIGYLKEYLPKQLEDAEVLDMISEISLEGVEQRMYKATLCKNLMPQLKGKFNSKIANGLIEDYVKGLDT